MTEKRLNRRSFFTQVARGGVMLAGAMLLLPACENKAGGGAGGGSAAGGAGGPKKTDCSDTSMLSEAEVQTRTSLKYVDKTPNPAKKCSNCKLFQKKSPCNGCTVVKGPIAAEGYCTAWAPA
jgi:hypothetical protein